MVFLSAIWDVYYIKELANSCRVPAVALSFWPKRRKQLARYKESDIRLRLYVNLIGFWVCYVSFASQSHLSQPYWSRTHVFSHIISCLGLLHLISSWRHPNHWRRPCKMRRPRPTTTSAFLSHLLRLCQPTSSLPVRLSNDMKLLIYF